MCGIAGIAGQAVEVAKPVVQAMTDSLFHRGPDGQGLWAQDSICLGHRRLAIIDLATGQQPMVLEAGGHPHAITFNGEIYNYRTLRQELASRGIACRTRSDTEVLLRLIMEDGPEKALDRCEGMFAFAYWNGRERELWLVRDRVGIKPLYYHLTARGDLCFSSSLESLILCPGAGRAVNVEALSYLFTLGYAPAPLTLYDGILELPPGSLLRWRDHAAQVRAYWTLSYRQEYPGGVEEAAERLDAVLDAVVKDHLESDVPVGAFLSGGLDSSAVVAKARKFAPAPLQTFTISFPEAAYDESPLASEVARHLGVRHRVIPISEITIDEKMLGFVLDQVGQPFADSSCLPTYLVSKAASSAVKVVLTGDGGDELFAGYETFAWATRIRSARRLPAAVRGALLALLARAPGRSPGGDHIRQLRKGLRYSLDSQEEMILHLHCILDPEELARRGGPSSGEAGLRRVRDFLDRGKGLDLTTAVGRFCLGISLPGDMLRKVDSMSMACSLEARVPLLDRRLVEFAFSLPNEMKIQGKVRKALLRRVMKDQLPASVFTARKWGFAIPLHRCFGREFLSYARESLTGEGSQVGRLLGRRFVDRVLSWNEAPVNPAPQVWSRYTASHALWIMVQLEVWARAKRISLPDGPGFAGTFDA